jgi:hypothetical protein
MVLCFPTQRIISLLTVVLEKITAGLLHYLIFTIFIVRLRLETIRIFQIGTI